ncbi:ketoacyl-ACP synthase III [Staphylococcus auricularis]|uniref:hypothetical protein n=1 Tax=Staphylococcus auricularis TaxID=29379 RepID=UPI0012489929|nr:hypothetical protein [Staphylococcus auricularis]
MDNGYFESFLDTCDEWICKMSGIKERGWGGEEEDSCDMAYKGSLKGIEEGGIEGRDIDMIVVGRCRGDYGLGSVGNMLEEKLGIDKVG